MTEPGCCGLAETERCFGTQVMPLQAQFLPDTGIQTISRGGIHVFAIVCPLTFLFSKNKRAHTTEILLALTLLWVWVLGCGWLFFFNNIMKMRSW